MVCPFWMLAQASSEHWFLTAFSLYFFLATGTDLLLFVFGPSMFGDITSDGLSSVGLSFCGRGASVLWMIIILPIRPQRWSWTSTSLPCLSSLCQLVVCSIHFGFQDYRKLPCMYISSLILLKLLKYMLSKSGEFWARSSLQKLCSVKSRRSPSAPRGSVRSGLQKKLVYESLGPSTKRDPGSHVWFGGMAKEVYTDLGPRNPS